MLYIHSLETFGTHEGPGIRFVIFVQGCNFRCLYCHNPDTQHREKGDGKEIGIEELVGKIENQREYFGKEGGVTVSGGEPLLQAKELIPLFHELRKRKIHTCLDTNGSILNNEVRKLLTLTDLVLLDIKHINTLWHKKITGQDNTVPLKFAQYLEDSKIPFWLRFVLVPGLTDQPEYLEQWAEHFQGFTSLKRTEILPFHTLGFYKYKELGIPNPLETTQPPSQTQIQQAVSIFSKYLKKVEVR